MNAKPISKELALELLERFKRYIPVGNKDQCWNYGGSISSKGYGTMSIPSGKRRTKVYKAHRVTYVAFRGEIPVDIDTDHLCRNRRCVNPWHLELVTRRVNILRGTAPAAINACKTHCIRGHEYTPENTITGSDGARRCRICNNASDLALYYRKRRLRRALAEVNQLPLLEDHPGSAE